MAVTTRQARAQDADAIGELAREFHAYLRSLGDRTRFEFSAQTYLRDGFGPEPAFRGLVAELDGAVIGYLLYHFGYDTDRSMRLMHIVDLYVREDRRRRGAGEALMRSAAALGRAAESRELVWTLYRPNRLAARFYRHLGARALGDLELMCWAVSPE